MENLICKEKIYKEKPILILVVPCYNEEEIIGRTSEVMADKLNRLKSEGVISRDSRILFVDDGSRDGTAKILHELSGRDPVFSVITLAGNSGHQNALLAGMMFVKDRADIVITIDADLQQDIEALDQFIAKYKAGCDVVYGVRNDRNSDGFMKKLTASVYYNLMQSLGTRVIKNHADYRLVSSRVIDALSEFHETNLFLRGLIPTMGFRSDVVYFDVKKREAGDSKYSLARMMNLAMNGITSFSVKPLHVIAELGLITVILGIAFGIGEVIDYFGGHNFPGYTTIVVLIIIFFGLTFIFLGVIGEYIAKIYMETKGRPHYIIDSAVWRDIAEKTEEGSGSTEKQERAE